MTKRTAHRGWCAQPIWIHVLAVVLSLCAVIGVKAQAQTLRAMSPADFQRLERIWAYSVSPDGQLVAYTLTRSMASGVSPSHDALVTNQRSEIWITPLGGGVAGRAAGAPNGDIGFWSAAWSPDSEHLALRSATLDGYVGLWIWERRTGKLLKLIDRGLSGNLNAPPRWISPDKILYAVAPDDGPQKEVIGFRMSTERAKAAWTKGYAGREPSVSMLESGIAQTQPQEKLAVIDVRTGAQYIVLTGTCADVTVAPPAQYVACTRQLDLTQMTLGGSLREGPSLLLGLAVANAEGLASSGTERAKDVVPHSLRWSPDGSRLALMGRVRQSADSPLTVFTYRPDMKTLTPMNTCGLVLIANYYHQPPQMFWTSHNRVIVYAQPQSRSNVRADWWLLSEKNAPRNITLLMKAVPSILLPDQGGESFLGVAQGKLWRLRIDSRKPQDLSGDLHARLTSISWPYYRPFDNTNYNNALSTIILSAQGDLYRYDIGSGQFTILKPPSPGAAFVAFSRQLTTALFDANDRTGTYLWAVPPASQPSLLMQTNMFVREMSEPQWKQIHYRSTDGRELIGWVLLPVGYKKGEGYPLVASLYAGSVYGTTPPYESINNGNGEGEASLLAAHGYAVLFPSMPRPPYGKTYESYKELTKGVLPAVDQAIALGLADPKRLGLIGGSYGGFSVYGMIAQTKRFKAAVALAGPADWISNYGQFNGGTRYGDLPQIEVMTQEQLSEGGQSALGAPPWKDAARYVRNSPIFYADRVQTPILIIQGDMDFVSIQQGEEFFMAMYRQGKRARFLRYWTSGHVIGGANALDMWKQIYSWFDEFLKPK